MRILIIGISTRAIAESARAAGYDFLTLDYFGDYDQKQFCENYSLKRDFDLPFSAAALYQASRRLSFDALAYTSNLENHPEVVARFAADLDARGGRLLGNPAGVLARVRDWPTLFGVLREQGIAIPEVIFDDQTVCHADRADATRGAGRTRVYENVTQAAGLRRPHQRQSGGLRYRPTFRTVVHAAADASPKGGLGSAKPPCGTADENGRADAIRPYKLAIFRTGRWLRKPIHSGGGHDVTFWPADRPVGAGFMLQEYIPGQSCSASFVANGRDCVLLGLTEQLIGRPEFGAGEFRYCGNILPLEQPVAGPGSQVEGRKSQVSGRRSQVTDRRSHGSSLLEQLRRITGILTREFGLVGVNGFDFVLDDDGQVYPLEVNPRYSASMELIEWAYGLSIFDLHVRAVMYGELPAFDLTPHLADPTFFGKAIVYAEQDGVAPETRDWQARGIRDVPFPGEMLPAGGPICTVLAAGPTRSDCFAGLLVRAKWVTGQTSAQRAILCRV